MPNHKKQMCLASKKGGAGKTPTPKGQEGAFQVRRTLQLLPAHCKGATQTSSLAYSISLMRSCNYCNSRAEVWTKFGRSLDEVWRQRTKFGQIIANKKTIKVPMKIHVSMWFVLIARCATVTAAMVMAGYALRNLFVNHWSLCNIWTKFIKVSFPHPYDMQTQK